MPTFTRKNAWNHNGTFDNTDLLWYAKAVQVMQNSPVSNPISWWSYAAIHGEFLILLIPPPDPGGTDYRYLNWTNINYISPSAALDQLPSTDLTTLFWDQCQHGTWFFAPWHRGYLAAIENILRDIIVKELNGPSDWALPYWNYLNQTPANPESNIPPAFTVQQLPDGTANPLYVPERYGKKINVGGSDVEDAVNDECQWDTVYNDGAIPFPSGIGNLTGNFYGGGETNFEPGGKLKGDLEDNPHNGVHGMVGGNRNNDDDDQMGLMGVPNTAALDPIFYLHHANIDRMWAAWNETGKNANSPKPAWLKGPTAQGDRRFAMPIDTKGTPWYYTPEDVQVTTDVKYYGEAYAYTYDDLSLTSYSTTPPAGVMKNLAERFDRLGIRGAEKNIKMTHKINTELVGASTGPITLKGIQTNADVRLNKTSWRSVSKSLLESSDLALPDDVFLELEGVKGGSDTNFLSVYVNEQFVKSVSLFGLLNASLVNSAHGGGLNFKFNITNIVDDMHLKGNIDVDSLNIQIKTKRPLREDGGITIDRIGIYRAKKIM
jgi:tyrosinase